MIFSYLIVDIRYFALLYIYLLAFRRVCRRGGLASGAGAQIVWVVSGREPRGSCSTNIHDRSAHTVIPACQTLPAHCLDRNFAMAVLVGLAQRQRSAAHAWHVDPQARASMAALDFRSAASGTDAFLGLLEGTVMLAGTTFTLASFHFSASRAPDGTAKRNRILEIIAWIGRIFIAITLGVLFAGVYMAALTAMIERLSSIINFIRHHWSINYASSLVQTNPF